MNISYENRELVYNVVPAINGMHRVPLRIGRTHLGYVPL